MAQQAILIDEVIFFAPSLGYYARVEYSLPIESDEPTLQIIQNLIDWDVK